MPEGQTLEAGSPKGGGGGEGLGFRGAWIMGFLGGLLKGALRIAYMGLGV